MYLTGVRHSTQASAQRLVSCRGQPPVGNRCLLGKLLCDCSHSNQLQLSCMLSCSTCWHCRRCCLLLLCSQLDDLHKRSRADRQHQTVN